MGVPGDEFMRFGLKMLLYLAGREFEAGGDLVLPTSNALSISVPVSPFGGSVTDLLFLIGAVEGPTLGETFSGSKAAPGSFKEGGAFALVDRPSLGGDPMILPYLVKPGNCESSRAFSGASSGFPAPRDRVE